MCVSTRLLFSQLTCARAYVDRVTCSESYCCVSQLPGPRRIDPDAAARDPRPTLKAIIMDFSAVDHIDVTAVQIFQDIRGQLDRHASPDIVEWHFAGIHRPWVKRALASAGFGRIQQAPGDVRPMYSIARIGDASDSNLNDMAKRARQRAVEAEKLRQARGAKVVGGLDVDVEAVEGLEAVNKAIGSLPVLSLDREVSFSFSLARTVTPLHLGLFY